MDRRRFLTGAAALALASGNARTSRAAPFARVRPGEPGWPTPAEWARLGDAVGGRLGPVRSPLEACIAAPDTCTDLFARLKNPYYLGDEPGLTQTLGWVGAWTSRPSAYAVAAQSTADVVAAVNFCREHRLRIVVKGGGHSYQGTSNAADSLLVFTRAMNEITLHDGFVPAGCTVAPQAAVSIGAGAIWGRAYDAVTTEGGRYVQGGGCLTVGVAGLVQSGGFGSFSKAFGTAAANLLEAEIVTADGVARTVNACRDPGLFWAIKGGGGGSFGVVTRLTLKTHPLPDIFGAIFATVRARSDAAFRRLIARFVDLYADALLNPRWGEQVAFRRDNALDIAMLFQGIDQREAEAVWRPFLDFVAAAPQDFELAAAPSVLALPARDLWDPAFLKTVPGLTLADDRRGAPAQNLFWAGNLGEAGQVLYAYKSAWLPQSLLARRQELCDALFAASRHWRVALHFNKGLAGAPAEAIGAARDTATNPAVLDAVALAIIASGGPPAYPGIAGHEPDLGAAQRTAAAIESAMAELRKLVPNPGSYVSESDFFEPDWQSSFWGDNYPRLLAVKERYDPDGLFFVHHGVGSELWSADGFTRDG